MQSLGIIKRGDTFSFSAELEDEVTGVPLIGASSNLRCQGRDSRNKRLIVELLVSEPTPGLYVFTAESTANWVSGIKILFDIEYEILGLISSSETFYAEVEEDITRD